MAEMTPTPPGGAVPPKPAETVKVQPKKETVRINLPPKPTSAPTIKLPTLTPGAPPPTVGATSAAAPTAAPSRAPAPPQPPPSGAAAATRVGAAPVAAVAAKPAVAAPAPRPMPVAAAGIGTIDKVLIFAALGSSLAGLAGMVFLKFFFPDTTGS